MKRHNKLIYITTTALLLASLTACGAKETATADVAQSAETVAEATEAVEAEEAPAVEPTTEPEPEVKQPKVYEELPQVAQEEVPELEGYILLWNDEFNGDTLDMETWRYEKHMPGWVNAELQEYTDSTDNVFVKDGRLIIKALKTQDKAGKDYYTSGKITTRGLKDFMYGKVIARAKVPEGQGLWPAFWMMPTKESTYGSWPVCGEIDIMEILGHNTNTTHGTIHYGNPHGQQQGTYVLSEGSFSDSFHEFILEWEPGEMRFYIDGNLYHTVNDWFAEKEFITAYDYPAPFNQDFYVQLNLAVGGTWPGDPDETTDFDNAEFEVDYVRVYQKPEYDTNVTKPEPKFRELTEDGNLIYNSELADEDLADGTDWSFLLNEGGKGSASIADGVVTITPEIEGTVDYALQLVQAELPLYKGKKYSITFDACATENRTMNVAVSAPSVDWIRYFPDTTVELTPDWQTYTYEFTMEKEDDNNGRLEFNMAKAGSLAEISIKNVRIEVVE